MLEVFRDTRDGYFTATENRRVPANLDPANVASEGAVQQFQIEEVSKRKEELLAVRIPPTAKVKQGRNFVEHSQTTSRR